jgi:hypothetical protein
MTGPIISPELAIAVAMRLHDIAEEMAAEIWRSVPEYARSRDTTYSRTVLLSSEKTLRDFVATVTDGGSTGAEPIAEVFRQIGRGEARCDRSLDALQAAMHVGAEVIWRRLSECCLELGMTDLQLCRLAEALLFHFRVNAAAAADGYIEARARLSGDLERHRRRLLELLLSEPPVSPEAIERVAGAANWRVPDEVSVVVVNDSDSKLELRELELRELDLPAGVLADVDRPQPCLIVPDPGRAGRLRALETALRGLVAAVGPPLPLADAARSMRLATGMLALVERGIIGGTELIHCVDHMSTLVIFSNEELLDTLASVRLAPLAKARAPQRDKLAETLLAWLQSGGDANEVAAQLYVHPQTVRYRIRQLQDLFGDWLHDPDVRLELELVLRARRLRGTGTSAERTPVVRLVASS